LGYATRTAGLTDVVYAKVAACGAVVRAIALCRSSGNRGLSHNRTAVVQASVIGQDEAHTLPCTLFVIDNLHRIGITHHIQPLTSARSGLDAINYAGGRNAENRTLLPIGVVGISHIAFRHTEMNGANGG